MQLLKTLSIANECSDPTARTIPTPNELKGFSQQNQRLFPLNRGRRGFISETVTELLYTIFVVLEYSRTVPLALCCITDKLEDFF